MAEWTAAEALAAMAIWVLLPTPTQRMRARLASIPLRLRLPIWALQVAIVDEIWRKRAGQVLKHAFAQTRKR